MSLADAIIEENIPKIQEILLKGSNLNQIDEYGFTPLIEAAIANNIDIARVLIDFGADVNLQDSIGNTALHWAAENNNFNLCKLLLIKGANPNAYNLSGQSVLVMPLLRQQQKLKKLLIEAGANLDFTQDFINTKFLGHIFELVGSADIVDPYNQFVEVDFEGFYLEVTIAMIAESLAQFKAHFAGKAARKYANISGIIIDVISCAAELIKYQQYKIDIKKHISHINSLLQKEPLLIPIGYEGHAISFIKFGNILVKCDRREESRLYDNVIFYKINRSDILSIDAIKKLIYEKQSGNFINNELPKILELMPITELKIPAQISGNCSWANIEAAIPTIFFLLFVNKINSEEHVSQYKTMSLDFFDKWREWNKDRALNFCIQSFSNADSIRKACKAELLVSILYQCCNEFTVKNNERAETILNALMTSPYSYVLNNYVKSYCYEDISEEGKNFLRLLKSFGYVERR